MTQGKTLSHDEKKASEAAFRGLPLDESWSSSAKAIYEGLSQALNKNSMEVTPDVDVVLASVEQESSPEVEPETEEDGVQNTLEASEEFDSLPIKSRRDAIESGILKDVTPIAHNVGLDFCVGMTNPLWDQYIIASGDLTDELIQNRLRDTMIAVRLRLASLKTPTALVDVPVLLHFPPETTPQLCLTFALFHKDPVDGDCLLMIHPGEVFATRQSFENN